jgi:hypothetical protein
MLGGSEPRVHFFRYMVGQFGTLERKPMEPIALSTPVACERCDAASAVARGMSLGCWRFITIWSLMLRENLMGSS